MTDSILRSYQPYTFTSMVPFPAAAPSTLLLDVYPNASFGYSFRKLRAAYAGSAVRIRRSSDNAEADIGFSGNDFDSAAAASHIGGGSGFIVTWYDQSGSALDVTNAIAANQPPYTASGIGSKPSMTFTAASQHNLQRGSTTVVNLGSPTTTTMFMVINPASLAASQEYMFNYNGGNGFGFRDLDSGATIYFDFGEDGAGTGRLTVANPGGWNANPHVLEGYRDTSNHQGITDNGTNLVDAGSKVKVLTGSAYTLGVGVLGGVNVNFFSGTITEIVMWQADLGSSNRTGARTNINAYYAIF